MMHEYNRDLWSSRQLDTDTKRIREDEEQRRQNSIHITIILIKFTVEFCTIRGRQLHIYLE